LPEPPPAKTAIPTTSSPEAIHTVRRTIMVRNAGGIWM
jgi:hypothetical protein